MSNSSCTKSSHSLKPHIFHYMGNFTLDWQLTQCYLLRRKDIIWKVESIYHFRSGLDTSCPVGRVRSQRDASQEQSATIVDTRCAWILAHWPLLTEVRETLSDRWDSPELYIISHWKEESTLMVHYICLFIFS